MKIVKITETEEFQDRFKHLGLKIAYYRKLRGWTQAQLAEVLDTSPSYVGALESPNMYKAISLRTLFRISTALQVEPSKLLEI